MNIYNFNKIYIEKKIANHKNVKRILSKINCAPKIEYFNDIHKIIKKEPFVFHPDDRSKKLVLSCIRGEILQKCPGSFGHICCNYHVINLYLGCPLNCTYCILQSYLNQPFIIINVDIEKIFDFLKKVFNVNKERLFRIGTGELSDSLVYDPLTDFSKDFIDFFSMHKNTIFEFKTKTDYIENILEVNNSGNNIVVGFSVNPQKIINTEEGNAVSLAKRLSAAVKLVEKGYKVAFHFDPIFNINNFDYEYKPVVDLIFDKISYNNIAWISLGTFRYTPALKNILEYNYPDTKILLDEFIESNDKKYRYFKPIRSKLYKSIINWIKKRSSDVHVYLCMESPLIWKETTGSLPCEKDDLFRDIIINKKLR